MSASRAAIGECWNTIGVRGDGSCVELRRHVHCHNCGVYSSAAQSLLDRPLSAADLAERSRHFARPKGVDEPGTQSVIIFRVAAEWLALPTSILLEVAAVRPIHSLPHRRHGALLGVVNVRGELVICVSLERLLGLDPAMPEAQASQQVGQQRLLVIRRGDVRAVCVADEIHGIHTVHTWELQDMPDTVAKATARHSSAVILWRDYSVGLLDDRLLFHAMQRSLS